MAKTREATRIDAHVGMRLRLRRIRAGMSQQEVAKLLEVSFQQVQKYEKGTNRISAGRLYILARILGMEISDFFEGADQHPVETHAAADGAVGDDQFRRVEEFIHSQEGWKLNLAFSRIANHRLRQRFIELVTAAQTRLDG